MSRPGKRPIEPFRKRLQIRDRDVVFQVRRAGFAERERPKRRGREIAAGHNQLLDVCRLDSRMRR